MKNSSIQVPPKWIKKFLESFLDPKTLEASLGDLEEKFQLNLNNSIPPWKARTLYVMEALGFIKMARRTKSADKHSN